MQESTTSWSLGVCSTLIASLVRLYVEYSAVVMAQSDSQATVEYSHHEL